MSALRRGQFVEHDGMLAIIVGTPEDGGAPDGHLALWYGEPRGKRISEGGVGGQHPELWTVPAEYCSLVGRRTIHH